MLAFGAFSGLQQFEGKAFGWRLVSYPLSTVIVPLAWWLARKPRPYPYAIDTLLVAPFVIDAAGNALDLSDTIDWWDDLNHFANWALLSLAVGLLVVRLRQRPWPALLIVIGVGATTAILWEMAEYLARGGNATSAGTSDTVSFFTAVPPSIFGGSPRTLPAGADEAGGTAVKFYELRDKPPGVRTSFSASSLDVSSLAR